MDPKIRVRRIAGHIVPSVTAQQEEERAPMHVLITGAAGQIGYALAFMIAQGRMLGPKQPLVLHLLDISKAQTALKGVSMELSDGAFPLIKGVVVTDDLRTAFTDVDVAVFVGAWPRGPGMERKDLLAANANIFEAQGKALDTYAKKTVRVLVVGNPANTNCLILMTNAPSIPRANFSCLTRLDHNRAKAQVASRLHVPVQAVKNVIIWGNHSSTQFPDCNHASVKDFPRVGFCSSVRTAVNDDQWLTNEFIKTVQQRGAAVIKARRRSSAGSAANAICDHIRDWILGTRAGEWVSMGVASDGSYGIKEGIIYSFPVTCKNGVYTIVQGLPVDTFAKEKMAATEKELREEGEMAFAHLASKKQH